MHFLGIDWVGLNPQNGRKLLFSAVFIVVLLLLSKLLHALARPLSREVSGSSRQTRFWIRQAISLLTAIILILGLLSIWFNNPARMTTVLGLMSAGLAFALQQVITSFAGYFVILRGNNFTVGDRISMGGVRGDVVRLGFIQTTIMEMGEPASVQDAEPAMWVRSRQFTGRIVTVSNSKIFVDPVFNYSRDFPIIWEEMMIPVTYAADRERTEEILLEAARKFAARPDTMPAETKARLTRDFAVQLTDLEPRVFYRITHNWLELSVRFIVDTHGIRGVKDAMSRFILKEMDSAGVGVAVTPYEVTGFPPLRIGAAGSPAKPEQDEQSP